MALANDQDSDLNKLSPTARRMLELRDAVLSEWEHRVRNSVSHAKDLPHPILINTFPAYYKNLAQAISPGYPRTIAADTSTIAVEHGSERARLTRYSPQSVIAEFQLLRWTILDVLAKNGVQLNADEFHTFNASIDHSVREAATAFAMAQAAMRERFVASLSHDLRNPLHISTISAQVLLQMDLPQQAKIIASKIIESNERIDRMISELLDCAMFQNDGRLNTRITHFDMLEVIREVCDQTMAVHGCQIEVAGKPAYGWWGRDEIRRALENLIGNAVKYRTVGTSIRVKVDSMHERVTVTVHNEGNPIPPDQLEEIFQVFRRTEAAKSGSQQGWGIGLPYVRAVAESHGGSINADSSVERGTTFTIDIPVDARPFQNVPTLSEKE